MQKMKIDLKPNIDLQIAHLSSFIQLLQKVQVSGWCFGFCIPAGICKIKVTAFGRFYNFAQILI